VVLLKRAPTGERRDLPRTVVLGCYGVIKVIFITYGEGFIIVKTLYVLFFVSNSMTHVFTLCTYMREDDHHFIQLC